MDLKYIAGRPMELTSGNWVYPGDEVDPSVFPYLDSFVSSGYLYVVHENKGYDRLPPHVYNAVMLRHEADAKLVENNPTLDPARDEAQERLDGVFAVQQAQRQAEVRSEMLDEKPGTSILERPDPVVEAARSDVEPPEEEQTPFQEPLPPVSEIDGPAAVLPDDNDTSPRDHVDAPPQEQFFDPSAHVAREVMAYVQAHPQERSRIAQSEREGKNRSTLLRDLES